MADYSRRHIRRKTVSDYQSALRRIEERIATSNESRFRGTIDPSSEKENNTFKTIDMGNYDSLKFLGPSSDNDSYFMEYEELGSDVPHRDEANRELHESHTEFNISIEEDDYRYSDSDTDEEGGETSDCDIEEILKSISNRFRELLTNWAVESNITHTAINKLLKSVRQNIPELSLPLDSRTLLKTPRYTHVSEMGDGYYCHYGTVNCVEKLIEKRLSVGDDNTNINLMINVDGLPLGKSSEKNLWPILCSEKESKEVYIVGIYAGQSKPRCPNEFLKKFTDEIVEAVESGVTVNGIKYDVNLSSIICDAPAKAYILCVKSHNAYSSCTKCTIEGTMYDSVCYPGKVKTLRTDEEFRAMAYLNDYQKYETVLNRVPRLGLVSCVPLDIMHLVYLGCCRKLLYIWLFKTTEFKLPARVQKSISSDLIDMRNDIPNEFARKTRDLKYIKFFKATEFRLFLLYTGPVVLKHHVNREVYLNFVSLHVAMRILCDPISSRKPDNLNYVEALLEKFVEDFSRLYGNQYVSHNVHNMLHIVDDVRKYGDAENSSAFRFENFLCKIKSLIRKGSQPLQQLSRRFAEMERTENVKHEPASLRQHSLLQQHFMGPSIVGLDVQNQFLTLKWNSFKIKCDDVKNS